MNWPRRDGFTTASGSAYEVDLDARRIRRVGNAAGHPPTPRQGPDGCWRPFHDLVLVQLPGEDVSIAIAWDGAGALTLTSPLATVSPGLARLLGVPGQDARS